MNFLTEPYPHQLKEVQVAAGMPSRLLLWEMGTGKTKGIIDTVRLQFGRRGRVMKTLILTPLVTVYNWKEEFALHSKINPKDILVIDRNGPKRLRMFEEFVKNKNDESLSKNKIVIVNWEAIRTEAFFNLIQEWAPEILIGDEIHVIKNHKAKVAKAAIKIARNAVHKYGATGTLILNSIEDVFMPFYFLDDGATFGKNFFNFKDRYMINMNASWQSKEGYFPDWQPREEMYEVLTSKIYSRSSRVLKKDVLKDLPPLVKTIRYVQMAKDQARAYKDMKNEFIAFVEDKKADGMTKAAVAKIAVTKSLRLLQIIGGYVTTDDGAEFEFEQNPKIDECRELLKELTPDHKVIIWCAFKNNYKQLGRLCEELKLEHVFITGQMSIKEKRNAMDTFRNTSSCRVIIANRKAGGIGINLVESDYSIIFSFNFNLADELQSEARNHRGGSQIHERITQIRLIAKGSIEELALLALEKKQSISDMVIDYLE